MGLVLQISDGATVTPVYGKLSISSLTSRTQVTGNLPQRRITFTDNRQTHSEWYTGQVRAKRAAMIMGKDINQPSESSSDTDQPSFEYFFNRGISVYTYGESRVPYLKTIQGAAPGSARNFQILPGKTVDVSVVDNSILFTKLDTGIIVDPGTVYREINVFLWYLYHALNVQAYRLHTFNPQKTGTGSTSNKAPVFNRSHWLGTVPEYQALVARWNWLVWKRGFLVRCEEAGETLNFSMGFSGTSCNPVSVDMTFTLTLQGSEHDYEDTIRFFTVYLQGVNTNVPDSVNPTIEIKKIGSDAETVVDGHGSDSMANNGQTWHQVVVKITGLQISQGEHYNAAFSVAVALNEQTAYFYQQIGNDSFVFTGVMEWKIGNKSYSEVFENQRLRTILLHSEEATDEPSIEYDGDQR